MKKVTATIQLNGESKTVTVMLDDKTYTLLKQTGDKALWEQYITEEYEASKIERKETRRHKSLDYLVDKGLEFEDERQNLYDMIESTEETTTLKTAMQMLTERQRIIVWCVAVEGQSFRAIGRNLGLNKDTVREHYFDGIKKLKLFFQNNPAKT